MQLEDKGSQPTGGTKESEENGVSSWGAEWGHET